MTPKPANDVESETVEQPCEPTLGPRRPISFRFGLRSLLIFAILFCFASAWVGRNYVRLQDEEAAIEALKQLSGTQFIFADEVDPQTKPKEASRSERIGRIFGYASRPAIREMHLAADDPDDPKVDRALASLAQFPEIETLRLNGTAFDDDAMAMVAEVHGLRSLSLDKTVVTAKGLEALAPLGALQEIDINPTGYEWNPLAGVAALRGLRAVRTRGMYVLRTDLAAVASLPMLEELRLHGMLADDQDVLAPLATAKGLKSLQVDASLFWSVRLDAIEQLPALEELVVIGVHEDALVGLRLSPGLRELRIAGPISVAGAQSISRAHPDCLVSCQESGFWFGQPPYSDLRNGEEVQP